MNKPYKIEEDVVHKVSDIDMSYGNYTYNDYLKWQFDEMVEIIRGKVFRMSPGPNTRHQIVSRELGGIFYNTFKKYACELFIAPFDVRFPDADGKIRNVVQPDLCVICDKSKIDDKGCVGAPDLVVEILSPSTSAKDIKLKYLLYEEFGVKEYWIVYPAEPVIHLYELNKHGKYKPALIFTMEDILRSLLFPSLEINLKETFEEINK